MLLLSATLLLAGCAGASSQAPRASAPPDTVPGRTTATTPARPALPAEDVTKYRPTFPAPKPAPASATTPIAKAAPAPTNQVNTQVDQRLRDQAYTNQNVKYTQGYRLLVYHGIEREEMMAIRRTIIGRYPDETDYVVFKSPVYRLYIGDYTSKLEAARGLARVKALTQKAELEMTQVLLNKTP
ncbi:hypothetical protein Q5H93_11830 [Hymenobacter sp. ASUV-10]|uniref:SPOR domain-containing protein n=1 Tax=Hymenobacter aranciens TaxID=3063996 RepID=A0ABT9BAY0_9BACT|nr:hypothetical protein [Hymenobacter sp. ASUV-10]MDO7875422.1 hypothetical protein [Hymenobacter sp. ASUV-10]